MPYITRKIKLYRKGKNLPSYADLIDGKFDLSKTTPTTYRFLPTTYTRWSEYKIDGPQSEVYNRKKFAERIDRLFYSVYGKYVDTDDCMIGIQDYNNYLIPKKSGGQRVISEPNSDLKRKQYEIINLFNYIARHHETKLYHAAAYAYIEDRSIVNCLNKHKANESNWFLKLDIKDCFGSTNYNMVVEQLSKIYPFNDILNPYQSYYYSFTRNHFKQVLKVCFLSDSLPQGAPTSPMLLNLMMIPFDYELAKQLNSKGFVYTRYADDIIISHKYKFDFREITNIVEETFRKNNYTYIINKDKIRYGSRAGRNWNLGLMLNKDNQITIGWRKKKEFKALLTKVCFEKILSCSEINKINGLISYYKMIDKPYTEYIIDHIGSKFKVDLHEKLRVV